MDKISIIIVTWNAEKFIRKCLESVFEQNIDKIEIFVVDNDSTDKTLKILEEYLPRIYLIKNKENKGFCFANNQALAKAQGDYIFTLNSDIVLDKNYIYFLKNYLKGHPKIGMAQGKFLKMDRKRIDSTGLYLSFFLRMFNIGEGRLDGPQYNRPRQIFGPCAAAALYKRKLLEDIKYKDEFFDNRFFFLVDDFDLAWRARNRGWEAMYVPSAVCYHYRGSSMHKSGFRQYLSIRNRYYLLIKNIDLNLKSVMRMILVLFLYDLPRLVSLIFLNRAALKALQEVRKYYLQMIEKRYIRKSK